MCFDNISRSLSLFVAALQLAGVLVHAMLCSRECFDHDERRSLHSYVIIELITIFEC